jgi:general secretion pathway protein D
MRSGEVLTRRKVYGGKRRGDVVQYEDKLRNVFYCLIIAAGFLLPPYSYGQQTPVFQAPKQQGLSSEATPLPPMPPGMGAPIRPAPQPGQQVPQPQPGPGATQPVSRPQAAPAPQQIPQPVTPKSQLPPPPSGGNVIQMNFDNIEMRDLIRFVSNVMGKNFVFDETVIKGKVTILAPKNLSKDDVMRVFDSVINYFGFAVVETPEAYKIVRGADAKGMAVETLRKENIDDRRPEDRVATYVANLDYLDSNIMVGVLRPLLSRDAYLVSIAATNSLIMTDTASNVQRLKEILRDTDVPLSKQLSSIKVYNVQHTVAADLAKTLQQLLAEGKRAQTPKDKIFVTSYPTSNSLLISAPPEDMKEIERIVSEIDTLRPQVLVEAAIIEVTNTKGQEFGVEWLLGTQFTKTTGAAGGFVQQGGPLSTVAGGIAAATLANDPTKAISAIGGLGGFNVGILGPSITFNGVQYPGLGAFVRAISTADNINILSHPQILTMNNEEAEVKVGENRPYTTSTRVDTAGLPINSYDYRDVGITLKVKPSINKDGFVYLNIQQEVTKVTQAVVQTGSTTQIPAPTTLKRSTKTTVGVRDSQTIVISGLMEDDSEGHSQGIPFLSSIPVVGYLFGNKTRTHTKTNLLVFITPRIIYNSQQISDIAKSQKEEQDRVIGSETILKKENSKN